MRERWQRASRLWEENKALANNLNLLGQLDYIGKLSSQLDWQQDAGDRPVRVVYTKSGEPTAALLEDNETLVDHLLYWIPCKTIDEANFLVAVINSDALQEAVKPLMSKGQFGARDLHKQNSAGKKLAEVRERRGDKMTVTIARRELRSWLRTSDEGKSVENSVTKLLPGG